MASNGVRDVEATPEVRFQLGGGVSIFGVRLLLATDDFYVPAVVSVLGEKSLTERLHKKPKYIFSPFSLHYIKARGRDFGSDGCIASLK